MSVLQEIQSPADLKKLTYAELAELAAEIRELMIGTVSLNGGHLASSLGVVELTIALHRVFDSPEDKIIWDVGHQSYAHKLITGRQDRFATLRQYGGLSGFPVRSESPYDAFGTGHAGTSVSAALGMALARDLAHLPYQVVAVIGDGSLGAGMALEAVNHAGNFGTRLIVVLNDNGIAITPTVGAISRILNRVRFDSRYEFAKRSVKRTVFHLPGGNSAWAIGKGMKGRLQRALLPGAFWEELGFVYLGPVDGYDFGALEAALGRARDFESKPVLVHVLTKKGKGYPVAEADATRFHGVSPERSGNGSGPSYSQVFGQTIARIMRENDKVVAITAAMIDGTGLTAAAAEFPHRVFDVGICEQHAVTLAAGLATQGFIPVVAIYSTFLQRAYDQIVHDVCLQNLPVVFAVDRAGIVGDDGKTHQGSFDISYLRAIPGIAVAAPRDEDELQHLLFTAVHAGQPMAVRYPRGNGDGVPLKTELQRLPLGKGEMLRDGSDVAILAIGATVRPALAAASELAEAGVSCAVADARFAKPLDTELVMALASNTRRLVVVEENALAGGFGSAVLELLSSSALDSVRVECLGLPDEFIEHGTQELLRAQYCLDAAGIASRIRSSFPEVFVAAPAARRGKRQTMSLPEVFARYRAEIDSELKSVLAQRQSPLYDMLRYHLGWVDDQGNPLSGSGGKALRPTLCLLACQAVGGDYHRALPAAAALELVHNFSLIHDDIQDNDRERRHRPTVWSIWGKPQAINAGTAMRALAGMALWRLSERGVSLSQQRRVQLLLDESCLSLIEGQFLDISYETRFDITTTDYINMVGKKTAALIACSLEVGALLGTEDERIIASLRRIGENLGLVFQMRDDILGIWGKEETTGKPRYSDILRKKKSFPAVYALESAPAELRSELLAIYRNGRTVTEGDTGKVLRILDAVDARSRSQQIAEQYGERAREEIDQLGLALPVRRDLEDLLQFLLERDF